MDTVADGVAKWLEGADVVLKLNFQASTTLYKGVGKGGLQEVLSNATPWDWESALLYVSHDRRAIYGKRGLVWEDRGSSHKPALVNDVCFTFGNAGARWDYRPNGCLYVRDWSLLG